MATPRLNEKLAVIILRPVTESGRLHIAAAAAKDGLRHLQVTSVQRDVAQRENDPEGEVLRDSSRQTSPRPPDKRQAVVPMTCGEDAIVVVPAAETHEEVFRLVPTDVDVVWSDAVP